MSGQIKRKEVDWERASCKGLDTEMFYSDRTSLMDNYSLTFQDLRKMCIYCPIWEECLKIGSAYEAYGFWGGVAEDERRHLYLQKKESKILDWLKRDLKFLPITYERIEKIVLSVERNFTYTSKESR